LSQFVSAAKSEIFSVLLTCYSEQHSFFILLRGVALSLCNKLPDRMSKRRAWFRGALLAAVICTALFASWYFLTNLNWRIVGMDFCSGGKL